MRQGSAPDTPNPLLERHHLPPFDRIRPDHAVAAVSQLISAWREALAKVLDDGEATWASVALLEELMADRLDNAFSPVAHLHSVTDSPQWRQAYADAVVKLSAFHTELNQDRRRFKAYREIRNRDDFSALKPEQQRIIDNTLRDFRLAGVDLDQAGRARYGAIVQRLTELSTTFQQNLQDATDAWHRDFDQPTALTGLPERALDAARERARAAGVDGYRINLEYPSYQAVLTYAEDRDLRQATYRAYNTRASDQGPNASQWDNGPIIEEMLSLRRELAGLVGFSDYADYSLATKMAGSSHEVLEFLHGLARPARPRAEADLAELSDYSRDHGGPETLAAWDVAFFSERLRCDRYQLSDEAVRPYFPYPAVLTGMLDVATELFGVLFRSAPAVNAWHPDVDLLEMVNDAGEVLAWVYVDACAREKKRGGAWMADCRSLRRTDEGWQRPVAFLTCNFPPATPEHPSLLSHGEVITLFHEFGHTLNHILTRVEHPAVGGISGVEWDAVELPSQVFENWCWQKPALDRFARHVETGDVLPQDLFERMISARHFLAGLALVRQLEFALTDWQLHAEARPDIPAIQQQVRDQVAVIRPPAWSRFLNGFSHLFAGGYGAGYYSYLWAEQLAADAFSRFEEEGVFNRATGQSLCQEVLSVGGSRDAIESFRAFRGRDPRIEPLLKSYGIQPG